MGEILFGAYEMMPKKKKGELNISRSELCEPGKKKKEPSLNP